MLPDKIAICGKATELLKDGPFDDPAWEIWTVNDVAYREIVPRWDRLFELHTDFYEQDPVYCHWVLEQTRGDKPVYLHENRPTYFGSAARDFPCDEIQHALGHMIGIKYINNTISHILTYILYERLQGHGLSELGIWGVKCEEFTEYQQHRGSIEYWLSKVESTGVKVTVAEGSYLFRTDKIYCYEGERP